MTPQMSIVGRAAHLPIFRSFIWRAVCIGGLSLVLALLAFFPERYLASSTFTPSDKDSLGLSGTLGQLGALNSVFGNQAAVEVALRIGNSVEVRDKVSAAIELPKRLDDDGRITIQRWLKRKVEVRSLRGGIILIEMQDRDAELAQDIVGAYQRAIRDELAKVSRRQTAYKRDVLLRLVADQSSQLVQAQLAYDQFRTKNSYAEPRAAMEAISNRIPVLEAQIKAKEVQLQTSRQVYTDNNMTVRQLIAELAAMQRQLAAAKSESPLNDQGVGKIVRDSSQLFKLERDLSVAKTLYDSYMRYLQGTAVEDITSEANLRVLEDAHVDTDRQIYTPMIALSIAVFLLWMAIEFYRLRPPVGEALRDSEDD